ncbi:hypothetical protein BABINDRAFT_9458 [Babjeviella inositovora NRRL Y-12698]|uniref:Endoplasmic reticulum transmembrane protein n=1 Tax=Babjeviella inositovora NRRL Y-12698 TaxID=984486 RepID=A0A1E3QKM8_9ASCO|nr:uncharacterized protein BABINDRAFT_9458 [Babjeviella inositovora NRRL Y-12698]ODQ78235.1 hypothetical protein BABINDRAFT_9458 [Babjeviella inositovora NRRL Y-12698]
MSIQMNLVFLILIGELAILAVLVAPLPQVVRSKIVDLATFAMRQVHCQVISVFSSALIGLMFLDSVHKLARAAPPALNHPLGTVAPPPTSEQLVRVFYAQRNMYLTGAVLFFGMAIGTVVTILKQLVRAQKRLAAVKGDSSEGGASEGSLQEIDNLKKDLNKKEMDVNTLKKQVDGLGRAFDDLADTVTVNSGDKKSD